VDQPTDRRTDLLRCLNYGYGSINLTLFLFPSQPFFNFSHLAFL
jgi:hypothetical protein